MPNCIDSSLIYAFVCRIIVPIYSTKLGCDRRKPKP